LPYNGAKPSASPGPTTTFTSSSGNAGPSDVTPEPSRSELTNLGTQSGQLNGMALGAADPSPANSGTNSSTEPPAIRLQHNHSERSSLSKEGGTSWLSRKTSKRSHAKPRVDDAFEGITLDIPSGGLSDELSADEMGFSKRRSILADAPKAKASQSASPLDARNPISGTIMRSNPSLRARAPAKILSKDEEALSQKVRSFYEVGAELPHEADSNSSLGRRMGLRWQNALAGHDGKSTSSISRATSNSDLHSVASSVGQRAASTQELVMAREDNELAGGMEDWHGVEHEDIDRYGFIVSRSQTSKRPSSPGMDRSPSSRESHALHRVSSTLQLASETPRRKHTIKRSPSSAHGTNGMSAGPGLNRHASGHSTIRPSSSQSTHQGSLAKRNSSLRNASNRLPHNKGRKLMDEAGDMLTLPPNLVGIAGKGDISSNSAEARLKETQRERKWQKMARVVSKGSHGCGMTFDFDTHSPKLIERTWKGIPDRWRATAWHAFLLASARKRSDSPSDDELIEAYNEYLTQNSPDDVQIDIDVPRTISSHIMFRRRYRGGQRLLFHVLHAMSLHFPETGYVQGMAALAATLLAYYEEEKAFVMLARLWDLRGLDKLYKEGFGGLIEALNNFEKHWLGQGEIAAKLVGIALP
jgi:Rab-GTPase-TBC domain